MTVKEEPTERNHEETAPQASCNEEDEVEQRNECPTESQENEFRTLMSKCVFCGKTFTYGDDPKLLECLHAACGACVSSKLGDHHTSVDAEVLRKNYIII